MLYVVEQLQTSKWNKMAHKIGLSGKLILWGILSIPATPLSLLLRTAVLKLQKEPYICYISREQSKRLPDSKQFSLLSWNICCVGAGYEITDGGLTRWRDRIDGICKKIIRTNADVNCLYETFDTQSAFTLARKLRLLGYTHIYFNIGPKILGVSSGIFVASKYNISKLVFTPYPLSSLVGRTKYAAKGIVSFDLVSAGEMTPFATIHATHLQHSEVPSEPTVDEVRGRERQVQLIKEKCNESNETKNERLKRCVITTGDFNLNRDELSHLDMREFTEGELLEDRHTWSGDEWCARLPGNHGKQPSGPTTLDYTFLMRGTGLRIDTQYLDITNLPDGRNFNPNALSDHLALLSTVLLKTK